MSNLPISSKYRSTPNEPVGEAERSQLSQQLNDAFTKGELDQSDYDTLLDQLFSARRLGDLVPVVERLGRPATYQDPEIVRQGPGRPGELTESRKPAPTAILAVTGGIVGLVVLIVIILLILL